jgi:hypothetical protein
LFFAYQVKNIRDLHFYEIVPVPQLQARLAADVARPALCSAMTSLLLNSYYPQKSQDVEDDKNKDSGNGGKQSSKTKATVKLPQPVSMGPEQMRRCLQFMRENLRAAVAFYSHFHKFTSVGSASKV